MQFNPRTLIGAFNMMFEQRSSFVYRANTQLHCLAMRRSKWRRLDHDFGYFCESMKVTILHQYKVNLRNPLNKKKIDDLAKFNTREDYNEFIVLEDLTQA